MVQVILNYIKLTTRESHHLPTYFLSQSLVLGKSKYHPLCAQHCSKTGDLAAVKQTKRMSSHSKVYSWQTNKGAYNETLGEFITSLKESGAGWRKSVEGYFNWKVQKKCLQGYLDLNQSLGVKWGGTCHAKRKPHAKEFIWYVFKMSRKPSTYVT